MLIASRPMEAKLKILAVDDEPSIRHSMRYIFGGPRYQVTIAESGEEALAKLDAQTGAFDIIVIDQKMPHLTGLELVDEIRKRGFTGKMMVLSAHLSPEIRAAYQEMEVNVLLNKPFNIHDLRTALDTLAA
jgi:CheY-like chemotaxis protein